MRVEKGKGSTGQQAQAAAVAEGPCVTIEASC